MTTAFEDLLAHNARYAEGHELTVDSGRPRTGMAFLCCMDARVDPWRMFGLGQGDAKVFRNAGARVTEDALRSIGIAVAALGVETIAVVAHTGCAMGTIDQAAALDAVEKRTGHRPEEMDFSTVADQRQTLVDDVEALRSSPLFPDDITVGGFVVDIETGLLEQVC